MAVHAVTYARAVVVAIVLALFVTLLPATPAHADTRTPGRIQTIVERKINRAREANGLRPLRVNVRLERFATDHAGYMAQHRTLVHDTLTRLRLEAPATALIVSENIARNTATNAAATAHSMFMHSAGHRANILDRRATHMGVGVVKRGGYTYIVQRFASLP